MVDERDTNPTDMPAPIEPATAETMQPESPASASKAPVVPLAGVPITPMPESGMMSTGPAVPSTDHMDDAAPTVATKDAAPDREVKGPYTHRD